MLRWLDAMDRARPRPNDWRPLPLCCVLEHLAQSIEMSMTRLSPAQERAVPVHGRRCGIRVVFKWRGKMSHGLDEAILAHRP